MKLTAWMSLIKLLILLRGSYLPEARPCGVGRLSAARLGTHVHKLSVQARTALPSVTAQTKPSSHRTSPIADTAEGWRRTRTRKLLPVPIWFKARKAMFSVCKRKMPRFQINTMERNPTTTIKHKKKQLPNLVICNAVMHKIQLGIALTTKL